MVFIRSYVINNITNTMQGQKNQYVSKYVLLAQRVQVTDNSHLAALTPLHLNHHHPHYNMDSI